MNESGEVRDETHDQICEKTVTKAVRKVTTKKTVKKAAKKRVQAVPKGYTAVTAHLVCKGAGEAMDFYTEAFGAKDKGRLTGPNGVVVHGGMRIGEHRGR